MAPDPHAARRIRAAERRRENGRLPDRRDWSGVRLAYWDRFALWRTRE